MSDGGYDHDSLIYDDEEDKTSVTSRRSRSRTRSRSVSRSRSNSRSGSNSSSDEDKYSDSDEDDSDHGDRSSPARASPVAGPSRGKGSSSLRALKNFVHHLVTLQTEDVESHIDQQLILEIARRVYGAKSLSDAYIPGARVKVTGEHLLGCPCDVCAQLVDTLDDDARDLVSKVQALRNWMPKGRKRPLCLLLPAAIPEEGEQPGPFTIRGRQAGPPGYQERV